MSFGVAECKRVCRLLQQTTRLRELHFHCDHLTAASWKGLAVLSKGHLCLQSSLEKLSVCKTFLKKESVQHLASFLQPLTSLGTLSLSDSFFRAADVSPVCTALVSHTQVKELCLFGNNLQSDDGALYVSDVIRTNCSKLQSLNLGFCGLDDSCIGSVVQACLQCTQLTYMNLSQNGLNYTEGWAGGGVWVLARGLHMLPFLTYLDVSSNCIGCAGVEGLLRGFERRDEIFLSKRESSSSSSGARLDGIGCCGALWLNVGHNYVTEALDVCSESSPWHWAFSRLQGLDISHNPLNDKIAHIVSGFMFSSGSSGSSSGRGVGYRGCLSSFSSSFPSALRSLVLSATVVSFPIISCVSPLLQLQQGCLLELDLRGNGLTAHNALQLGFALSLYGGSLKILDVGDNPLYDDGCSSIIDAFFSLQQRSFSSCLRPFVPSLVHLGLENSYAGEKSCGRAIELFTLYSSLVCLNLKGNACYLPSLSLGPKLLHMDPCIRERMRIQLHGNSACRASENEYYRLETAYPFIFSSDF
eukprot:2346045-Rhodomonas_salina.1